MTLAEADRAFSATRGAREKSYWYAAAYLGRYAGQACREVFGMTITEANALMAEVSRIVEAEQQDSKAGSFEPDE